MWLHCIVLIRGKSYLLRLYISLYLYPPLQIIQDVETLSDSTNEHPLALLAEQAKKLVKNSTTMYFPILTLRHQNASAVAVSLIHKLYGIKLVNLHPNISSPFWLAWKSNYSNFLRNHSLKALSTWPRMLFLCSRLLIILSKT